MGNAYGCGCGRCGYHFEAMYGVRINFPYIYKQTLEAAKAGDYGSGTAEYLNEHPDATLNAGYSVYLCPECNNLQCEINGGLYLKKDGSVMEKDKGNILSVMCDDEDWQHFVTPTQLHKYYKLVGSCVHTCDRCGAKMKALPERTLLRLTKQHGLKCPECGGALGEPHMMLWD